MSASSLHRESTDSLIVVLMLSGFGRTFSLLAIWTKEEASLGSSSPSSPSK